VTRTCRRRPPRERIPTSRLLERAGIAVGLRPETVEAVMEAYGDAARVALDGGRPVAIPWFGVVGPEGVLVGGDDGAGSAEVVSLGELLPLVVDRTGERPATVALAVAGVTVEVERAFGRNAVVELPIVEVWTGRFGTWEPSHPVFGDERR
jgi:hypothetical protein